MTLEPLTPDRRRAMTRRYLLDAAAIVFARDGFHGATLDEVAKTAGFTKGAVYSNFKSKDDLFLELHKDVADRELAVLADFLESGPHDRATQLPRVRELLRGAMFTWHDTENALFLEFVLYARHKPELKARLVAIRRQWRDFVAELIDREYEAWGARKKYPTRDMAQISLALFSGLFTEHLLDPELVADETVDTVLSLLYDTMGIGQSDDVDGPAAAAAETR
jgi:AcrR family transcriptional regulator